MTKTKAQKARAAAARRGAAKIVLIPENLPKPRGKARIMRPKAGKAQSVPKGMIGIAAAANFKSFQQSTMKESGTDYLVGIDTSVDTARGDVLFELVLTASMTTRLQRLGSIFQRWKPKITAIMVGGAPSTTSGEFGVAIVRDPDDLPPKDPSARLQYFMGHSIAATGKWWETVTCTMPMGPDLFYTSLGEDGVEPRTYSPGKLYIFCVEPPGAKVPVTTYIQWSVDFSMPSIEDDAGLGPVGPKTWALPTDGFLPYHTFDATNNLTLLLSKVYSSEGITADPATVGLTYVDLSDSPFTDQPDGTALKLDRVGYVSATYSTTELRTLYAFDHLIVRREAWYKGIDPETGSVTVTQVDGFEPAFAAGSTIVPIGKSLTKDGTTGNWIETSSNAGPVLTRGTLVTQIPPNMIETDITRPVMIRGKVVHIPTGKKQWLEVENKTLNQDILPIVRVVGVADPRYQALNTNTTLQVPNDGLSVNIASVNGTDLTSSTLPVAVSGPVSVNGATGALFDVNLTHVIGTLLTAMGVPTNILAVQSQTITDGKVPTDANASFSGVLDVNVKQVEGTDLVQPYLPVNISQLNGVQPYTITDSVDNKTILQVGAIGMANPYSVITNKGVGYSAVTATDGTLKTTAGGGISGTIDVNLKEIASMNVAKIELDGNQAALATSNLCPITKGPSQSWHDLDTTGPNYTVPFVEYTDQTNPTRYSHLVYDSTTRPVNIAKVGRTNLNDLDGSGSTIAGLPVCICAAQATPLAGFNTQAIVTLSDVTGVGIALDNKAIA